MIMIIYFLCVCEGFFYITAHLDTDDWKIPAAFLLHFVQNMAERGFTHQRNHLFLSHNFFLLPENYVYQVF